MFSKVFLPALDSIKNAKMCIVRPIVHRDKLISIDDRWGKGWTGGAGPEAAKKYNKYFPMQNKGLEELLAALRNAPNHNIYNNLSFIDHGGGGQNLQFGDTIITLDNFEEHRAKFEELRMYIAPDAYVHLWHCNAGDNPEFIKKFAESLGVPIIVSDTYNNPTFNIKLPGGKFLKVHPDGTIEKINKDEVKDLRDIKTSLIRSFFDDMNPF